MPPSSRITPTSTHRGRPIGSSSIPSVVSNQARSGRSGIARLHRRDQVPCPDDSLAIAEQQRDVAALAADEADDGEVADHQGLVMGGEVRTRSDGLGAGRVLRCGRGGPVDRPATGRGCDPGCRSRSSRDPEAHQRDERGRCDRHSERAAARRSADACRGERDGPSSVRVLKPWSSPRPGVAERRDPARAAGAPAWLLHVGSPATTPERRRLHLTRSGRRAPVRAVLVDPHPGPARWPRDAPSIRRRARPRSRAARGAACPSRSCRIPLGAVHREGRWGGPVRCTTGSGTAEPRGVGSAAGN